MLKIEVANCNSGVPEYSHTTAIKSTLINVLKEVEEVLSEVGMNEIRKNYEVHIKFE